MQQRNYVHSQNKTNVVIHLVSEMILFSSIIIYIYIYKLSFFTSHYNLHYYYYYYYYFIRHNVGQ
jgi:hypothetical protein